MKKAFLTFWVAVVTVLAISATPTEIVVHTGNSNGNNQIYVEPPYMTYDDDMNELYVYFGTTGTIDFEYDDGTGAPYYYIYGESHVGYTSTIYTGLPAGYYTITIHSIYGYTYTGNFSVS